MENLNTQNNVTDTGYDKKTYYKTMLICGLAIGLLMSATVYGGWIFDTQALRDNGYVSFLLSVVILGGAFIIYGKRAAAIADVNGDGYSYGRAYGFALLSSMIAAVVAAVLAWLLYAVIDPAYTDKILSMTAERVEQTPGATPEAADMATKMTRFFLTFPGLFLASLFGYALSGGLVGLITSAIVKRNPSI